MMPVIIIVKRPSAVMEKEKELDQEIKKYLLLVDMEVLLLCDVL